MLGILPKDHDCNKIECTHCAKDDLDQAVMVVDTSMIDTTGEPIYQFLCKRCLINWINNNNEN